MKKQTIIRTGLVSSIGLTAFVCAAISPAVFGTGSTSGNVQLNTEVATSIAMKIVSPNDVDPNCTPEAGKTYGVVNRYASSTGDDSGKMVDTFDGREGQADEINTNTSCATLSMTPNTFDSTYSDVTVYTNSGTGYSLSVRSTDNTSPNLVNTADSTFTIPAGTLTEQDGTGEQAGQKIVPGGQNKWAIKTDTGVIDTWTAVTTEDQTVRAYDQATNNGDTTRVTYGISAGSNPTGKYATTLTYTATMFDDANPEVLAADITGAGGSGTPTGATISGDAVRDSKLTVPYKATRTLTITPDEGYYLTSFTCPTGFTCSTPTTGSASAPTAASRAVQTISITNNSIKGTTADPISIAMDNTYRISFTDSNVTTKNASNTTISYIDIPYGSSATITVTPASGYYLSAFSGCPAGWTCSGVSTGTSYTGNQTLTLQNDSSTNTGTLTLTGTVSDPWASCGVSAGSVCTVDGVTIIRLADGRLWTYYKQSSGSCPSGMSLPSDYVFESLVRKYSGGGLYSATGWTEGDYRSSTERGDWGQIYILHLTSSSAYVSGGVSGDVVCYR